MIHHRSRASVLAAVLLLVVVIAASTTVSRAHARAGAANQPLALLGNGTPLTAADLQDAYGVTADAKEGGKGHRVYVVSFGYVPVEQLLGDLNWYRQVSGFEPCIEQCFEYIDDRGRPVDSSNMAPASLATQKETTLDVEMVAAVCPNCDVTVMAMRATLDPVALVTLKALGAKWVTSSFGYNKTKLGEGDFNKKLADAFRWDGIVYADASGDDGYDALAHGVGDSPRVLDVGGTSLVKDVTTGSWSETGWAKSGSTCATSFAKPEWQAGVVGDSVCAGRAGADLSAVADLATSVKWYFQLAERASGGTSVSAPVVAGIAALADAPADDQNVPQYVWRNWKDNPSLVRDITEGPPTGNCGTIMCNPSPGWDGPTGLGSPRGPKVLEPRKTENTSPIVIQSSSGATVDGCLGTNPNVNSNGYTTVWKTACGIGGWQQHWRFTLWNGDEARGRRAAYSFRHLDADGNPDGCLSVRPGAPNSGAGQQLVLAPCFASSGILYPGQLFAMEPSHLITDQKRTLALTADFGGDNEPARLDAVGSDPRSPGQSWQLRHVS